MLQPQTSQISELISALVVVSDLGELVHASPELLELIYQAEIE